MAAHYFIRFLRAQWQQPYVPAGNRVRCLRPQASFFFNFIILYSAVLGHDSLSTLLVLNPRTSPHYPPDY